MFKTSSLNIRVIDSLNFLPMALAGLLRSQRIEKGYFPHLFNSRENQNYVVPLPEARYYSSDTMSTPARQAFMSWHEEHKGNIFNFQTEMLAYCRSDVDILRRCCLEFRAQFLDGAAVDPFQYVTIASACMETYRRGHIQPNTIAMVPTHGYVNSTNYCPDSIRWLDFVAASEGNAIKHALNGSGDQNCRNLGRRSAKQLKPSISFRAVSSMDVVRAMTVMSSTP
ncbi:probable DNA polymerase [Stegodyphus dumicola]|uniref:probable DNA polymerase n=1 Tax=Stegodyphus dumicola TaxID=202533 RepID=UPI0015A93300|nr:probable DNA polymerase [Stegodyphus dumicola]